MFGVFSSQLDRFVITFHFNSIKTALNAYFLQKVDFCIFEPKNRELIENSSKAPLNCNPLECTYLGKISFQYHKHLERKAKMKSGHLELWFNVYRGKFLHTKCRISKDLKLLQNKYFFGNILSK